MNNGLTFAKLDQILQSLGFTFTRVPNSHLYYEHTASGALLVLRLFDKAEAVDPGTLAVVRRTLIDNGLLDRARWEEILRERSLAG